MGFPAKYEGCLSVGAINDTGARSSFSDYGTGLDVMAPGENILSSTIDGGYEAWDGTSMATPYVSGIAALLFSQGLSRAQVINTIESTTTNMGPAGYDTVSGFWRGERRTRGCQCGGAGPASRRRDCPDREWRQRTVDHPRR